MSDDDCACCDGRGCGCNCHLPTAPDPVGERCRNGIGDELRSTRRCVLTVGHAGNCEYPDGTCGRCNKAPAGKHNLCDQCADDIASVAHAYDSRDRWIAEAVDTAKQLAALRAENERLNCAYNSMLRAHDAHALEADRYRRALEQAQEVFTQPRNAQRMLAIIDAALGEKP